MNQWEGLTLHCSQQGVVVESSLRYWSDIIAVKPTVDERLGKWRKDTLLEQKFLLFLSDWVSEFAKQKYTKIVLLHANWLNNYLECTHLENNKIVHCLLGDRLQNKNTNTKTCSKKRQLSFISIISLTLYQLKKYSFYVSYTLPKVCVSLLFQSHKLKFGWWLKTNQN